MASPPCITIDSGDSSDSDVEFVADIKPKNGSACLESIFNNGANKVKREVDFIPVVSLDDEDKEPKKKVRKLSGRKMVSDAVEIVSSISASKDDDNVMKIEQVFSLKMTDKLEQNKLPESLRAAQERRRMSLVTPHQNNNQFPNSAQAHQRRRTSIPNNSPRGNLMQNQMGRSPKLGGGQPQRSQNHQIRNRITPTFVSPVAQSQPTQRVQSVPVPTLEPKLEQKPSMSSACRTSSSSPSKHSMSSAFRPSISSTPRPSISSASRPSPLKSKQSLPQVKSSPSKPKSSEPKPSSSQVQEIIQLSDSEEEKKSEEEQSEESDSENSPNVQLSKDLITKLINICLKSKLNNTLKKQVKSKLTRYIEAASPNVLKRNYFIRMVKEVIKDVDALLDCPEVYESHEITLCDKIKTVIAELKKDSIIVNNKLINLINIYNKLKRRIERLEEMEVESDEESENPYIILDKYQKRATIVYNKICKIQDIGNHADRPYLQPFSFKGRGPEPVERALEVYYNKTRKFPNFKEVLKLTQKVNREKNLKMGESEVMSTAQSVFYDFGQRLQARRQRDDYHNLVGYIKDGERDPAVEDSELHRKLEMNKHLYKTKELEVLDKFAKLQATKGEKKKSDESEDESNETDNASDEELENERENSIDSDTSDEENPRKRSRSRSPSDSLKKAKVETDSDTETSNISKKCKKANEESDTNKSAEKPKNPVEKTSDENEETVKKESDIEKSTKNAKKSESFVQNTPEKEQTVEKKSATNDESTKDTTQSASLVQNTSEKEETVEKKSATNDESTKDAKNSECFVQNTPEKKETVKKDSNLHQNHVTELEKVPERS